MMLRYLVIVCAVVLCCVGRAEAACTGSGLVWSCAAGTTPAEVTTTLSSATDGATLTFATGTYTWAGARITPITTKAVTFLCAVQWECDITISAGAAFTQHGVNVTSTKLWRWSGFDWIFSGAAKFFFPCDGGSCQLQTFKLRIDHNRFTGATGARIFQLDTASQTMLSGVFDHNTITYATQNASFLDFSSNHINVAGVTARQATANNLIFEDNIITTTAGGGEGCTDGWGPQGIVLRYNTITNCRMVTHGADHAYGWDNFEVYRNQVTNNSSATFTDCYRSFHHQGSGQVMVWGNTFTCAGGYNGALIALLHYRSFNNVDPVAPYTQTDFCDGTFAIDGNRTPLGTYQGYPCYHQPGRDYAGNLYPVAAFKNTRSDTGAKLNLVAQDGTGTAATFDYTSLHMVNNRDYFNAVSKDAQTSSTSPFDGTTGIGHGTLANRPETCTTTTEAADAGRGGVMYWATDQGSWNTESAADHATHGSDHTQGEDGVLYLCTATNVWSLYYVPYAYPDPLIGAAASPAAPVRLRFRIASVVPTEWWGLVAVAAFVLVKRRRSL